MGTQCRTIWDMAPAGLSFRQARAPGTWNPNPILVAHRPAWCGPMTRSSSGTRRSSAAPSCAATQPATTSFKLPMCCRLRLACARRALT
jgi:hypothetical protein